jgi:hypothetical protein
VTSLDSSPSCIIEAGEPTFEETYNNEEETHFRSPHLSFNNWEGQGDAVF